MHQQMIIAVKLIATAANSGESFHIGPWIIVPILMLAAIIGTPIYVIRDRRKRRSSAKPK